MAKNEYPPMGLDDVFKFGKYKEDNMSLYRAIMDDLGYVTWCIENANLQLDDEAFGEYQTALGDE